MDGCDLVAGRPRLIERSKLTDAAKVKLWQPFIAPSMTQLHEDNRAARQSCIAPKMPHPDIAAPGMQRSEVNFLLAAQGPTSYGFGRIP